MSDDENTEEHKVSGDTEIQDYKGKTTLRVVLDKEKIKGEIKDELQIEERADKAMAQFLLLKKIATEEAPVYADQIEACQRPSEIMELLEAARSEKKPEKRAPFGKSTFIAPPSGEQYASQAEMIDDLYSKAYSATEDEATKKEARAKINQLWHSFETGKSASLLRESQSNVEKIMKSLSECPECHRTITPLSRSNPTCPYCNYDVTAKNEGRKGTSIQPHEHMKTGVPPK